MPAWRREAPASFAGRLYDDHGAALYRYALMLLADHAAAEDAIQQVFSALLKNERPPIEREAHYLRRAVRNECYSILRRRVRHRKESLDGRLLEPQGEDRAEERLALERALRELSPDQREVVHLHVYEGRTFKEIADLLDESVNTIASRYRYALQKLRTRLE
jgi:RNA polymerase sigma-70 factor, ECF subfamily